MRLHPVLLIGLIFTSVSLVFAAIGSWFLFQNFRYSGYSRAAGEVTAIRRCSGFRPSFQATVRFPDSTGAPHEITTSGCRSVNRRAPWTQGETLDVLYPPQHPEQGVLAFGATDWLLFGPFALLGWLFTGIGAALTLSFFRKAGRTRALRETGLPVVGHVIGSSRNRQVRWNGRCPFRIEYEYTDSLGKVHRGFSEDLWFDPVTSGHLPVGAAVHVYVSRQDASESIVDLSEIQKRAA